MLQSPLVKNEQETFHDFNVILLVEQETFHDFNVIFGDDPPRFWRTGVSAISQGPMDRRPGSHDAPGGAGKGHGRVLGRCSRVCGA